MDLYKKILTDIIASLALCFFILSLSVVVTLNFRPLYYYAADEYDVEDKVGLSLEEVKENYDALIDYNNVFGPSELEFPDLAMSEEGEIHFVDVKNIFVAIQVSLAITTIILAFLAVYKIKRREFYFLQLGGFLTIILPLVVGIGVAIDWENAFVLFHEIAFSNDYWIFNPVTDPVILILPSEFFMYCATMIVSIALALSTCALISFFVLNKEE